MAFSVTVFSVWRFFANDLLPFQGKQARLLTNCLSQAKVTKPTALMYGILMVATPMNF